jgi:rhamnogalacturonan endolyase
MAQPAVLGAALLAAAALSACSAPAGRTAAAAAGAAGPDTRGAVAVPTDGGTLITWRWLATDAPDTLFHVERDGRRITAQAQALTQFLDRSTANPGRLAAYRIIASNGSSAAALGLQQAYLALPLQPPGPGYQANDGAPADLTGDGRYEIVLKWQPANAKDNSQPGTTSPTYIDAYTLAGQRLWRIDLGPNVRSGAHYTPFVAYDFDGDGRAELMLRTADGTVDGTGRTLGHAGADHRNERGYVLQGDEFITVFDGRSGAALARAPYAPARGQVAAWGDDYGNRVDRFLAGVAYLDGQRPSAVFSRGYYTRAVIAAWDWRGGQLRSRWVFDSADPAQPGAARAHGQGAHWFAVADVDADGRDDIVYGAATIGSNGRLLHSTGLGHGDALHVGRHDLARPGLQTFMVHESPRQYGPHAIEMHDSATGQLLWSHPGDGKDIGRGVCMDIDPAHAGNECWASAGPLFSARGEVIGAAKPRAVNFGLWWDGDLLRETLDGTRIAKWQPARGQQDTLLDAAAWGAAANNGTKATPVFSADILGDWREEVVWRSADSTQLFIAISPHPSPHRVATLMSDRQYRVQVAAQNAGYNQPPHPSFFLGHGAPAGSVRTVNRPPSPQVQAEPVEAPSQKP